MVPKEVSRLMIELSSKYKLEQEVMEAFFPFCDSIWEGKISEGAHYINDLRVHIKDYYYLMQEFTKGCWEIRKKHYPETIKFLKKGKDGEYRSTGTPEPVEAPVIPDSSP